MFAYQLLKGGAGIDALVKVAACSLNFRDLSTVRDNLVPLSDGAGEVVDVGGADTLTRSFGAVRTGGNITTIGSLSGRAKELNPGLIFARRANVQGISEGSSEMFEAMNRAIAANAIQPAIDKVFGFDDIQAVFNHMASGARFGKIVVRVAG